MPAAGLFELLNMVIIIKRVVREFNGFRQIIARYTFGRNHVHGIRQKKSMLEKPQASTARGRRKVRPAPPSQMVRTTCVMLVFQPVCCIGLLLYVLLSAKDSIRQLY